MAEPTIDDGRSPNSEECWALVERILASSELKRAQRLRDILLFVSRRSLKEGNEQIPEQEIGTTVFGRSDGYDTSVDTIVRVTSSELRKRIHKYFENEGTNESIVMEIPRGSYVPIFRSRLKDSDAASQAAAIEGVEPSWSTPPWFIPLLSGGATAIIVLAILCAVLWVKNEELNRSLYSWKYSPAVAMFWSGFLGASPNTDIVLPDLTFSLIQHASNRPYSFDEYMSRSYLRPAKDLSPQQLTAMSVFLGRNLDDPIAFRVTERLLALDPISKSIHVYDAHDYIPELMKRDNVILLGGRTSNPWDALFESLMNFTTVTNFGFDGNVDHAYTAIMNRAPKAGEQGSYRPSNGFGYCDIAYLPSPDGDGRALVLEATNHEAIEAASDFLLSEEQMANFRKLLHVTQFPYFEVLLKVSSVKGTPLNGTIEAYRVYPNLH